MLFLSPSDCVSKHESSFGAVFEALGFMWPAAACCHISAAAFAQVKSSSQKFVGVFAAFNQMISDRRISQLLRDRAVEVDVCIEWLLATIHLQDPEESSDLFSISPFTSPVSDRSGSDTQRYSIDRVESAATKLAASVCASLTFSTDDKSPEETQTSSPTFSQTVTKP